MTSTFDRTCSAAGAGISSFRPSAKRHSSQNPAPRHSTRRAGIAVDDLELHGEHPSALILPVMEGA
jgi:hypothetical protein